MDMKEIYRVAREKFKGACRVCPVCNGRACAGEMPGIGGIGTGSSFMANFDSLARIKLNLRTIHEAREPDIGYDFFGRSLKMPILVAPLAGMVINMGNAMEERPYLCGHGSRRQRGRDRSPVPATAPIPCSSTWEWRF